MMKVIKVMEVRKVIEVMEMMKVIQESEKGYCSRYENH